MPPTVTDQGAIDRLVALSLDLLDTSQTPVRRGQHPKAHGCVVAQFHVEPNLPEPLRRGVFAAPRTFPALLRFSNGRVADDGQKDIHGLAIKLLDVPGRKILDDDPDAPTQDFLLADQPAFFVRDLPEYLRLSKAMLAAKTSGWGRLTLMARVVLSPYSPWRRLRRAVKPPPPSPLRTRYWSQTPYRLGDRPIKFQCRPVETTDPDSSPETGPDRLRTAMAAELAHREVRFDFHIQTQADPATMPVEDPTQAWDETASPPVKVATIVIPAQSFDDPSWLTFAENLSFTPWHTLPEHSPLGAINGARLAIYNALSARRHDLNQAPRREPTAADLPPRPGVGTR